MGNVPEPGKRYEVAVTAGLADVLVLRDLCVAPGRFERIDYMAVVAFRVPPR